MAMLEQVPLDPAITRWIARYGEVASATAGFGDPDLARHRTAAREVSDAVAAEFTSPVPDGVAIEDLELDGPHGASRVRRYRPDHAPVLAPTQLWLHGGGFFAGSIHETLNDRICAALALRSGVQILSLDYRLAPEHPYPAAVEDAISAAMTIAADPGALGVDRRRLGIGGNSAGAAIAASAALRLRDSGEVTLIHLDAEVIPASLPPVGDSGREYATGFGLDGLDELRERYFGPAGPADAYGMALEVPDLAGLPPTLLMLAEHDPLRDAGLLLADRLAAAGVPVIVHVGDGHLHASLGLTAQFAGARAWNHRHAAELAAAYGTDVEKGQDG
ncbi:alpha/beta hydrolase fold domain-containing protein [Homoserinibacter sp. YIM 151385]|uniref:alpha/beta hydrolase fold domain-containing protein n=1 Tax=Homoserinibacter sp. YIM 151385 TaxID=2985506 RepID=UPI0022F02220|nr:alpha/beta hydrolase fold domain-containing protein [Homoserinibacter sp. YIM 151385]WBU37497.1 alpha/beta hydrolase fold domain-containing protein [Homoserinibacter sp. YIM 151385]